LSPIGQALQVDPWHDIAKSGQPTSEIGDGLLSAELLVEGIAEQNDSVDANSGWVLPLDSAPSKSTPSPQHHKEDKSQDTYC
jgi:hypothetical protein